MHWGDWRLPTSFELLIVAAFGGIMLMIAILQFSKTD